MVVLKLIYKDRHVKIFDFPRAPEIFRLPKRIESGWSSVSFKKRDGTLEYDEISKENQ